MNEKRWVQHISGQGEKWEAIDNDEFEWIVRAKHQVTWGRHFLPKSEYRLCDPPEEWRDITERIVPVPGRNAWKDQDGNWTFMEVEEGYRLRKVQAYQVGEPAHVFIVEQKVSR